MRDEQGNNLYSIGKLPRYCRNSGNSPPLYDEQGVLKPPNKG